ncbi:MAG: response regulator transcription factor [Tissierellia bacterium]|nr:response regulator transcription factor [Tissierellia bacterium]
MKKILLIEDDKSLSIGLVYYFNKEDFFVKHVVNIADARVAFENDEFDIVLLDVTLPDGEGFSFGEEIRKKSNIPIIFLTAKDEESDILKGFEVGGDDYITKPFSLKELYARIKSLLKRSSTNNVIIRKSGEITVDIQAIKVYKGEKIVDLTSSEYKLLNYFMDNYNIALSREKILEFLWDSDANFSAYSTISVYINRLREKIEDNPGEPKYILTKRSVGYIWGVEVQ